MRCSPGATWSTASAIDDGPAIERGGPSALLLAGVALVPSSWRRDQEVVVKIVEVFADVRCPFTHVGLRRLVQQRNEAGAEVALWVRAWPLELVNSAPLEGTLIAEEVEELRDQVAPDLFSGFDVAHYPASSLPALGLAAAAYRQDVSTGERASLALREAMFEKGIDIAEPDELARIASEVGLHGPRDGHQAVLDDWAEGRRRDVVGSPHFFVDGLGFFCPSLRIARVDGHLHISNDAAAFQAFVQQCLTG
jgi:predicted DsbA family dithiol-disulfide isomerase